MDYSWFRIQKRVNNFIFIWIDPRKLVLSSHLYYSWITDEKSWHLCGALAQQGLSLLRIIIIISKALFHLFICYISERLYREDLWCIKKTGFRLFFDYYIFYTELHTTLTQKNCVWTYHLLIKFQSWTNLLKLSICLSVA